VDNIVPTWSSDTARALMEEARKKMRSANNAKDRAEWKRVFRKRRNQLRDIQATDSRYVVGPHNQSSFTAKPKEK